MLILVNLVWVNNRKEMNCLECQEKLVGRRDQKFCCDYCRNTYNNRINEDAKSVARKINSILRKNRRILSKLNPNGKKQSTSSILLNLDFIFTITHTVTLHKMAINIFFAITWIIEPLRIKNFYSYTNKNMFLDEKI